MNRHERYANGRSTRVARRSASLLLLVTTLLSSSLAWAPAGVLIGNEPSIPGGTYINAQEIADNLVFTSVFIEASFYIRITDPSDLSASSYGMPIYDFWLTAPTLEINQPLTLAASGNLYLDTDTIEWSAPILTGGIGISPSKVLSSATHMNVHGPAASIKQACTLGSMFAPVTVSVDPGAYAEPVATDIVLSLSLSNASLTDTFHGSALQNLTLTNSSAMTLNGGAVAGSVTLSGAGNTFDWRGAAVSGLLSVAAGSTVRVFGSGFEADTGAGFAPVPFGPVSAASGQLRGALASGDAFTTSFTRSGAIELVRSCGDGTLDPGEGCDDGNAAGGDGCSANCQLEATPTPSPTATSFVTATPTPVPTTSPTATPLPPICGNNLVEAGEQCDDGNLASGDGCSGACLLELCAAAPRPSCLAAAQARLQASEKTPGKESLKLQWKKVEDVSTQGAFGDPVHGTTRVAVCLYGDANQLIRGLLIDRAGQNCGEKPCWKATGTKGYGYQDKAASSDGFRKVSFAAGAAGKGKADAQAANNAAKGQTALPSGLVAALSGNFHPTVQLVTTDGFCVGATMTEATKDDGLSYDARKK